VRITKARYTPVSTVQCVMDRRANKPAAKKQTPLGRASVVTREISEQPLRTGVHAAISTALRSGAVKKPTSLAGVDTLPYNQGSRRRFPSTGPASSRARTMSAIAAAMNLSLDARRPISDQSDLTRGRRRMRTLNLPPAYPKRK